jgi:hypothetical protein
MGTGEKKNVDFGYRTTPTIKAAVEAEWPAYAKIVEERKEIEELDLSKFHRKIDEVFVKMMKAGTPPDYPPKLQPMPDISQQTPPAPPKRRKLK